MSKKISFIGFLLLVLIFSIAAIHAIDANATYSNMTCSNDNPPIQLEDASFNELKEDISIENETPLNEPEDYSPDMTPLKEAKGNSSDMIQLKEVEDTSHDISPLKGAKGNSNENSKNQTELVSPTTTIYYTGSYNVTLMDSDSNATLANKTVNFIIDDIHYTSITDINGTASVDLKLIPGKYTAIAYFTGDDEYEPSKKLTVTLEVLATIKAKDISRYYAGSEPYIAEFFTNQGNALANHNVTIIINGKPYNRKTNHKGFLSLAMTFSPGTYKIIATDPLTGYTLTTTFKILSTISASNVKKVEGDDRKFAARFLNGDGKALANHYVKFKLKSKIHKVKTNSEGKAILSLKKYNPGTYKVTCYNPDGLSKTYTIKVYKKKADTKLNSKFYTFQQKENKTIKVQLTTRLWDHSCSGRIIKIKINGKTYSRKTDNEGHAYLRLPSLKKGIYVVEYEYKGNKYFKASEAKNFVTIVNSAKTAIKIKSTKAFGYGAGTLLKMSYSAKGVPLIKRLVVLTIDNKTYVKKTDNHGIITMPINLKVGKYEIHYKTYNESKVNGTSGSFKINVFKRGDSKIIWKCGKSYRDTSQTFKVLLVNSKGKPISKGIIQLTINSKTYTAVTNSKGIVKFTVHEIIGKYKVSIEFKGSNNYIPGHTSKSVNVMVSKFGIGINEKAAAFLKAYLKSSSHCQVGHPKIKALVKSLTRGLTTKVDKAKAIFNYVRDTLSYSYYYDTWYGSVGTLNVKRGNCVDHSHLLVAMYRTAGMKARYVHGTCVFNSGGVYGHVWTQVLIGKYWICGDPISYDNSLGKITNWNTNHYVVHNKYASLPF